MKTLSKKEKERVILQYFVESNPQLKVTDVCDSESPDFVCRAGNQICGIEVVRFVFSRDDAIGSYCDRLVAELNRDHLERGFPFMNVHVHLASHGRLRERKFRQELKEELLDFLAKTELTGWPPTSIKRKDLPELLCKHGVTSLSLLGGAAVPSVCWSFPHAIFLPESDSTMIQSIINAKNQKILTYRREVKSAWLLIVAGALGLNSMIEATDSVVNETYHSSFDRVFLFKTFGRNTHELKLASAPITISKNAA